MSVFTQLAFLSILFFELILVSIGIPSPWLLDSFDTNSTRSKCDDMERDTKAKGSITSVDRSLNFIRSEKKKWNAKTNVQFTCIVQSTLVLINSLSSRWMMNDFRQNGRGGFSSCSKFTYIFFQGKKKTPSVLWKRCFDETTNETAKEWKPKSFRVTTHFPFLEFLVRCRATTHSVCSAPLTQNSINSDDDHRNSHRFVRSEFGSLRQATE